jgi:hypothetical protein
LGARADAGPDADRLASIAETSPKYERGGNVMRTAYKVLAYLVASSASRCAAVNFNLVAHRTRTLPRAVSRAGVLVAALLLIALVLIGAGYVLPGAVGQMATWLGYGLGVVGWLGLPLYALLLAARVFGRPESPPRFVPADPDHVTGAVRP